MVKPAIWKGLSNVEQTQKWSAAFAVIIGLLVTNVGRTVSNGSVVSELPLSLLFL